MYRIIMNLQDYLQNTVGTVSLIIGYLLATAIFVFVIGPFHNYLKARVASACGDEWVEEAGYVTMNPVRSFHWVGFVSVLVTRMGFTKRIRYRRRYLYSPILGSILIGLSGVLTYFVCFLVVLLICEIMSVANPYDIKNPVTALQNSYSVGGYIFHCIFSAFSYLSRICICSALFNLIPITPMDMGEVLFIFMGKHWADMIKKNDIYISLILFILAFFAFGMPDSLIVGFSNDIVNFFTQIFRFIINIFI